MRSKFLIAGIAVVLAACTNPSEVRDSEEQRDLRGTRTPWPAPDLDSLSETERLGWQIYLHDQAAWKATDAFLRSDPDMTGMQGYITEQRSPDTVLVRFIGTCGDELCPRFDVTVTGESVDVQQVRGALTESQTASFRARQLAVNSGYRMCTPNYNSVVLETEHLGERAWRIYLLAASREPDTLVLSGHHRFLASGDGRHLIEREPLSNGCMVGTAPAEIAAPFVTHVLHDLPQETHVFTSLDYRMPLFVGTETGLYKIEGASIEQVRERDPASN